MRALIAVIALAVAGCGDDEPITDRSTAPGFDEDARTELEAAGVGKYLGAFAPEKTDELSNGETVYTFAQSDAGPTCIFGTPYRVSVRDVGASDLLIFLEGGGACWSDLCAAKENAGSGVLPIAWTDPAVERNPLAALNVVFASYCDGSVFSGDNVIIDSTGAVVRRHRGLANLSAALGVAKTRFPNPSRIVLAGTSAGGYGTILGTAVVRLAYPDVPLFVINDAGLGLTNPEDPSVIDAAVDEWKVSSLIPASCAGCLESGQFTSVVGWGLDHDPTLRVAYFSAYRDAIISGVFLNMEGEAFETLMLAETDKLHAAHPDRFERFFVEGSAHTAVLAGYYDATLDGTLLTDWIVAMLDGSPVWRDLLE